jgi:phage repressor protein C with HTH and peptisase S24 domain
MTSGEVKRVKNANSEYFGHRLRHRLGQMEITGTELASLVGVANSTVSQWVRGVNLPTSNKALSIAEALDCSHDWLIYGDGEQPKEPIRKIPVKRFDRNDVAGRLAHLMTVQRYKPSDLAKLVNVSRSTVTQWMHGTANPSGQNLIKVSDVLDCDPNWLLSGSSWQASDTAEKNQKIESYDESCDQVYLPLYTDNDLIELKRDGNYDLQNILTLSFAHRKLAFNTSTLKRKFINSDSIFCLKVNIPTMYPLFPDETTLGVDTETINIQDGNIYAFWHFQTLRVAHLFILPSGEIRIRNQNQTNYPDEIIDIQNQKNIVIIGRIFWYSVIL